MPVIGSIQPDALSALVDEAKNDGFVQRFLWAYPDAQLPFPTEASVAAETMAAVHAVFAQLNTLRQGTAGMVQLSPEAAFRWQSWQIQNTLLQRPEAEEPTANPPPPFIAQAWAKLPSQLARLALILHTLEHGATSLDTPLQDGTMGRAIRLVEYFRAHGQRVLSKLAPAAAAQRPGSTDPVLAPAKRNEPLDPAAKLLDVLPTDWTSKSTLLRKGFPAAQADQVLATLETAGQVEKRQRPSGGRPATEWRRVPTG